MRAWKKINNVGKYLLLPLFVIVLTLVIHQATASAATFNLLPQGIDAGANNTPIGNGSPGLYEEVALPGSQVALTAPNAVYDIYRQITPTPTGPVTANTAFNFDLYSCPPVGDPAIGGCATNAPVPAGYTVTLSLQNADGCTYHTQTITNVGTVVVNVADNAGTACIHPGSSPGAVTSSGGQNNFGDAGYGYFFTRISVQLSCSSACGNGYIFAFRLWTPSTDPETQVMSYEGSDLKTPFAMQYRGAPCAGGVDDGTLYYTDHQLSQSSCPEFSQMTIQLKSACSNLGSTTGIIGWYDPDGHASKTPENWSINFQFSGSGIPTVARYGDSPTEIGGQGGDPNNGGAPYQANVVLPASYQGTILTWQWNDVLYDNGIEFYVPSNSVSNAVVCPSHVLNVTPTCTSSGYVQLAIDNGDLAHDVVTVGGRAYGVANNTNTTWTDPQPDGDWSSATFNVVSTEIGSGDTITKNVSIGPCAVVTCNYGGMPGIALNSGNTYYYDAAANVTDAATSPPSAPQFTITLTGVGYTGIPASYTPGYSGGIEKAPSGAPLTFVPTSGTYTITWGWPVAAKSNSTVNSAGVGICSYSASTTVAFLPFFEALGGDVEAGVSYGNCTSSAATITAFSKQVGGKYYGASSQYAAIATSPTAISGFSSAEDPGPGYSAVDTVLGIGPPNGLTLANNGDVGQLGNYPNCIANYYTQTGTTGTPVPGTSMPAGFSANVSALNPATAGEVVYQYGQGLAADTTPLILNAGTINAGNQVVVVVTDQNVNIQSSGANTVINYGPYTGVAAVPAFELIDYGGNIYVDHTMTSLEGDYIDQPDPNQTPPYGNFVTCSAGVGTSAAGDHSYTDCDTSALQVNGSVSADTVEMLRTLGDVNATSGAMANPAEVYTYSPEVWLPDAIIPSVTQPDQSIVSLPPIL